jgi:peroxiredoxin
MPFCQRSCVIFVLYKKDEEMSFRRLFFLPYMVLLSAVAFGQSWHIRGSIPGIGHSDVFLLQDFADSQRMMDTVQSDLSGTFDFTLKTDDPVGMYRIMTSMGQMFEVIFNRENIAFTSTGPESDDLIKVEKSVENLIYYKYLHVKTGNELRINVLRPVLDYYPHNDSFYSVVKRQVEKLQQQVSDVTHRLIENNPGTLAAHFIAMDEPVPYNPDIPANRQDDWMKKHYFDHVDFNDTLLLRTHLFTAKLVGYLTLYQKPGMDKKSMEKAFFAPVDTILQKSRVNEKMYLFCLDYLLKGFQSFGFDSLLLHISQTQSLASLPGISIKKVALQQQMDLIKRLAIGRTAPDFTARTLKGKKIRLSKVKADRTLLVFWASWCPHCTAALPKLKKYYDPAHPEKLQVIAISVDDSKKPVLKEIKKEGYQWPNIAEQKGWNSPIALRYGVSSTPTFFLLDKDKRIVAKPAGVETLIKILQKQEK